MALHEALAGDVEVAHNILAGNKAGHRLRGSIEDACLDIMLLQQPLVGEDLRFVTGCFRVVSDLVHIDEMSRDVAQLALQVPEKAVAKMGGRIDVAIDKVADMLKAAVQSFMDSDEAQARNVFVLDDEVDALYEETQGVVVELIRDTKKTAKYMPELLMVAKYFERIGDDAQHIADWAIFRATGEHPVHSRKVAGL